MEVPHGIPAKTFIDQVNLMTMDEATRSRILLAEVLLRLEKIEKKLDGKAKEEAKA
jgi:hypothetical protein